MSGMDKYDPARLDYDVRLLRQFYLSRGYAEIDVERVQGGLLQNRSGFAVTFSITEGTRFKFGDISIGSEIENLDLQELLDVVSAERNDWYDSRVIEEACLTSQISLAILAMLL